MNPYTIPGINRPEINIQLGEMDEKMILRCVVNFVNDNLDMVSERPKEVDIARVFTKTRKREYALTRQIYMYLIKRVFPKSTYAGIGRSMGNRDHSTIMHGVQTINNLIDTDKKFAAKMAILSKHLGL